MVRRPKVPRSLLENGHWGFPPKATHYPEWVEARVGIASVLLESIVIAVSRNPEVDRARELGWNNEERNLAIEYRWLRNVPSAALAAQRILRTLVLTRKPGPFGRRIFRAS